MFEERRESCLKPRRSGLFRSSSVAKVGDSRDPLVTAATHWCWKYRYGGKEKRRAIGRYPTVSLADARRVRNEASLRRGSSAGPLLAIATAGRRVRPPAAVPPRAAALRALTEAPLCESGAHLVDLLV
jgi:hypothetical protein